MPQLLIQYTGGAWEAVIANTNQALEFDGANDGAEGVRQLADAMADGWDAVTEAVLTAFKGVPNGVGGDTIAQGIFGTVDSLVYEGTEIVPAVAGRTLMSIIEDAGEALLAEL